MAKILTNKFVQIAIALLAGLMIGAIFYPSKTITEEERQRYEEKIEKKVEEKEKLRKELTEKIDLEKEKNTELRVETERKIAVMKTEIRELQAKTKKKTFKLVKPDGTIIEKTFSESEVNESTKVITEVREEFNQKVTSIEKKWMKVHKERVDKIKKDYSKKEEKYKETIAELSKKKEVKINERKFGVAIGYLSNENYYSNVSYDIAGPLFLNLHTESDFRGDFAAGLGIGLRF